MNEYRGETEVEFDGHKYVLRFTTNAQADCEQLLGKYGLDLAKFLCKPSATTTRAVFWAALKRQMPHVTPEIMGDMITRYGGYEALAPAYWLLLVNGGLIDRAAAEAAGVIPSSNGRAAPKDGVARSLGAAQEATKTRAPTAST